MVAVALVRNVNETNDKCCMTPGYGADFSSLTIFYFGTSLGSASSS
jgi:hypothetical protein